MLSRARKTKSRKSKSHRSPKRRGQMVRRVAAAINDALVLDTAIKLHGPMHQTLYNGVHGAHKHGTHFARTAANFRHPSPFGSYADGDPNTHLFSHTAGPM